MNDTNPAAWTTDTITAVNSFEGTVRMRLHHPFLCTESDLEAARRYLCDFIEKMESGRNEELNRRLAEAVDRHERLQAGYAQMARQQEHDAREKLRLFDYAGQLKPLAEALIESALDSDAAGRPEGALADNALALRAALAKNPNPSGHATGCGNSDNAADSILTSEGGRTKAGASDAVGTESTPARSGASRVKSCPADPNGCRHQAACMRDGWCAIAGAVERIEVEAPGVGGESKWPPPMPTEMDRLRVENDNFRRALDFYAKREHYVFDGEPDDWDSVSGEPQNWLCAPSIPPHDKELDLSWMVEDGGIARMALAGQMTPEDSSLPPRTPA